MHTQILHRLLRVPVLREVFGAVSGGAVALVAYGAFEFVRGLSGIGSIDVLAPVHASASTLAAHGAISFGLSTTIALAGGCAFIHRRILQATTMSEID
jgi:hypothetical protein